MSEERSGVVRQRATLVLPSSGAFDSRAWRIASSLAARGHDVTVLARSEPGLPNGELRPDGYRVIRVPVSAEAGLPGPVQSLARRLRRRGPVAGPGRASADEPAAAASPTPTPTPRRGFMARIRAGLAAAWRLGAIALTVRSQRLATRPVAPPADLVHAMAYMGIPIGLDLGRRDGAPVVYDARDIYVHARNIARLPGPARRLFGWVEKRWAHQANRVMTVNRPYAEVMEKRFGPPRPAIVMNCSFRREAPAERPRRFHDALALSPNARIVLYQGGLAPHRGIEQLISALEQLAGNVHLCLLGYGPLEAAFGDEARRDVHRGRLHVLAAVPPADLLDWVESADIVAMPIQPSTLNHRLTTPNKLFEAMAAGVPVVASDLPGMAPIVRAPNAW